MILCSNPKAQYLSHKEEIDSRILSILDGGSYINGGEVRAFENEFAGYIGCSFGIGCGNGTDALCLAIAACGIGPGDEVITVSHTAVATVAAIEMAGATPVLVDIDRSSFTMSVERLEDAVTSRTKAVIPVHLYGQPADLDALVAFARRHGIRMIEDCAQAHGALYKGRRVGAFGDASCFSFYPTKNLGALGDGGMVVTSDAALAEKARALREYGWRQRYVSEIPGRNSRLDEVQAGVLRVKLQYLDRDNERRRGVASQYSADLQDNGLVLPVESAGTTPVYHLYVVRSARRDQLQAHLRERSCLPLVHYPVPIHLQPAYRGKLAGSDRLPETERAAAEVLSLPMYPELDPQEIRQVIDSVRLFGRGRG
jgi:dTDP-4-amino-4,6-dideoxygalactose transaminase